MDSANAVTMPHHLEPWVEKIQLPVLKKLIITLFSAHYGKPICLEELGYPIKEVTLDTLGYSPFCIYTPFEIFYRQGIQPLKNMDPVSGTFHAYSCGTLILFTRVWKYDYNSKSRYAQPKDSKDHNDMIIRAYLIKACEHDYKITHSRMCYREYECSKCGHQYSEDSSD